MGEILSGFFYFKLLYFMKYSVVCPTMWRAEWFPFFANWLAAQDYIHEVIVIDNDKSLFDTISQDFTFHKDIKLLHQRENIFVGAAWNLGVEVAEKDDIIIMNDDVVFTSDFVNQVEKIKEVDPSAGLIGCHLSHLNTPELRLVQKLSQRNTGLCCLFYMHRKDYVPIPPSLKVFYTDDWLVTWCQYRKQSIYSVPVFGSVRCVTTGGLGDAASDCSKAGPIYVRELMKVFKTSTWPPFHGWLPAKP